MKIVHLIIALAVLTTSFSCRKDNEATPMNQFSINGTAVAFPNAFLNGKASAGAVAPGTSPTYGYRLWLSETGVTYGSDGKFSGTGKYFSLELKSTTPNEGGLPAGTYSVENEEISVAELRSLTATGDDFVGDEPTKGSVTISKSVNSYTIEIDLTMSGPGVDNSFPMKGQYVGTLTVVD